MTFEILTPTALHHKPRQQHDDPPPATVYSFTAAQWRVYQNGQLVSLLGYTGVQLSACRDSWGAESAVFWNAGHRAMSQMMGREDVQLSLTARYGDETWEGWGA